MSVTISEKAKAVSILLSELTLIEQQQLNIGEQMAKLSGAQIALAWKSKLLNEALSQLVTGGV